MNHKAILRMMKNKTLKKFIDADILYQNGVNKPFRFAKTKFKKSDLTDEDLLDLLENFAYFLMNTQKNFASLQNDFSNKIFDDMLIRMNDPKILSDTFVSNKVYDYFIEAYIIRNDIHNYYDLNNPYLIYLETKNMRYVNLEHIIEDSGRMDDSLKKRVEKGLKLYLKRIKDEDLEALKLLFKLQ